MEHWMRGWRVRVERDVRMVEHWRGVREWVGDWTRRWRARVGRDVRRVEHWMRGGELG